MGIVNIGNQVIHWRYRQPAVTEDINKWFFNIFDSGIYSGGEIQIIDNAHVLIQPFAVMIETPTNQLVKIQTNEAMQVSVNPSTPYIVAFFAWENDPNNFMDVLTKSFDDISATDIILGAATFDITDPDNLIITDIDYTKKKTGQLKID